MMLGLIFATPLLLIGVGAAAIPFVLHLLSSVRAQEVYFPTLRFLRMSMEKTARRRRIQHWLLLLLRAALLGLLAIAVAEPISTAVGGWFGGRRYAAAIVLDNSLSMGVREKDSTRFAQGRAQGSALLSGEDKPTLAALLTTNGGMVSRELTERLDSLREELGRVSIGFARAPIPERVAAAVKLLNQHSEPQKSVYIFSDMQRISFEDLMHLNEPKSEDFKDIHLLIVNTAQHRANNVAVSDLEISGQAIVNRPVRISATLVNSSPTARVVQATLRIEGKTVSQLVRRRLAAAGREGSSTVVHFHHAFTRAEPVSGEVFLDVSDDLGLDNVRRFALNVGGRVKVLVVRGPVRPGEAYWYDPGRMLLLALDPFEGASSDLSILPETVESERFGPETLKGADIAFFCEVPSFTREQAQAITAFAANGGTAVFFLGPEVSVDNYNDVFVQQVPAEGGLLPGRLSAPVGEVGPDAPADPTEWVDTAHPYFQGLYENHSDYLGILVQRHYPLIPSVRGGKVLIRLGSGDPLLLVKPFGPGNVVLCTTTASPRWTNLPTQGLFVAMVSRMSLLSRRQFSQDNAYLPGAPVLLRPVALSRDLSSQEDSGEDLSVIVTLPDQGADATSHVVSVPLRKNKDGVYEGVFKDTTRLGVYRWRLSNATPGEPGATGAFVVNPSGAESDLAVVSPGEFVEAMRARGIERVHVGATVQEVNEAAAAAAQGRNWWDLVVAVAAFVLVVEAVVANRRRREQPIPPHLNPRLAG